MICCKLKKLPFAPESIATNKLLFKSRLFFIIFSTLEVIVDKSTSKVYYSTPQEKFEKLNKINPLLDQFKKDLKLDL